MKKYFGAIALSLIAFACSNANVENEKVVKQMFEYFNQHEWQKMAAQYSDKAEFLDPSFGVEYVTKTREETAAKYAEMQKMFPDLHDEVVGMYSVGDKVVVEFVATGSSGDSIQFKLPIASVLTIKDGKIVKDATYYDNQ